jgi:hypothetical protein
MFARCVSSEPGSGDAVTVHMGERGSGESDRVCGREKISSYRPLFTPSPRLQILTARPPTASLAIFA